MSDHRVMIDRQIDNVSILLMFECYSRYDIMKELEKENVIVTLT